MSCSPESVPSDAARRFRSSRALVALGVGGFSIGTGEFVIMGLLPEVAGDVGVTIPAAGHLISAYAVGVMVGAPVLAVLAARWPRRALLVALMAFYALANFATALVPGHLAAGVMRFASGLLHGTYFGVAALNHSAFNFANALGAWLGGLAIAMGWGWTSTGWVGASLAIGGLLVFGVSLALQRGPWRDKPVVFRSGA